MSRHVILQRSVCDTFHEAIAESTGGNAERLVGFTSVNVLDDVGISSSSVNQLTTCGVNEEAIGDVAGPEFHCLAEGANVNGLVTFNAANIVIGGSKSIRDGFPFAEEELIVLKSAVASGSRRDGWRHAIIYRRAERAKAVK